MVMKWDSTQIENQHFQYRLGSKLVEELIASHSLLDILLELSQNSYDAYAKKLTIDFRDNDVIIQDDGEGFSVDGWRRVTVVLSTGYIGENSETVDSKSNSLGSKNIGLRTLFLIGDKIHIKSRGKQTIINIVTGVPDAQIPDSETSQNKGVFIRTQFRQFATGNLLPFTLQQEQYLLDKIADKIGPSLIKLSGYDGKKGLKEVVVRSSRCNKEIVFRLKTEKEKCTVKNLKIIHRYATISSSYLPEKSKLTTIHEIEYQHLIDLPAEYNTPDFVKKNIPKYFGSNKNIAMGFSVRLKRGKLDLNAQGNLYYPIVVPEAYTKSCISISAPFMLDSKRENIQPPNPQSWNLWLLETASDSIVTLMKDDWDKRFGVDGFIAAVKRDDNTSYFSGSFRFWLKAVSRWCILLANRVGRISICLSLGSYARYLNSFCWYLHSMLSMTIFMNYGLTKVVVGVSL